MPLSFQLARRAAIAASIGLAFATGNAAATAAAPSKGAASCDLGQCTWEMLVDGVDVLSGTFASASDGSLYVPDQATTVTLADGSSIGVRGLNGNIDPILGFSVSAGTGAVGRTFSFAFSMPIALDGTILANSSVSYSLTALGAAGAQLTPLFGSAVVAQEVDTTVGGLAPLNKGVDVGAVFAVTGGPVTANSPVYTASNSFIGSFAYDLMSVTVSFALSPQSQVGVSGFVQQLPAVPEPAMPALALLGLVVVAAAGRRHSHRS